MREATHKGNYKVTITLLPTNEANKPRAPHWRTKKRWRRRPTGLPKESAMPAGHVNESQLQPWGEILALKVTDGKKNRHENQKEFNEAEK